MAITKSYADTEGDVAMIAPSPGSPRSISEPKVSET